MSQFNSWSNHYDAQHQSGYQFPTQSSWPVETHPGFQPSTGLPFNNFGYLDPISPSGMPNQSPQGYTEPADTASLSAPSAIPSGTSRAYGEFEWDDDDFTLNNGLDWVSPQDPGESISEPLTNTAWEVEVQPQAPKTASNADLMSKRAGKNIELKRKFGEHMVTKDNRIRGKVHMGLRGNLLYYDQELDQWIPAGYHHDYREDFIALDAANNQPYTVAPARGLDEDDITSNCDYLSQNTFHYDTYDAVQEIQDDSGRSVMTLQQRPDRSIGPRGYLVYLGMVMLDQDDHPLLDYGNKIPLTFSSCLEGGRVEALRRIVPGLQVQDLRARMPKSFTLKSKVRESYGLSTLRHRCSRWRNGHKIKAWDERKGTATKTAANQAALGRTSRSKRSQAKRRVLRVASKVVS